MSELNDLKAVVNLPEDNIIHIHNLENAFQRLQAENKGLREALEHIADDRIQVYDGHNLLSYKDIAHKALNDSQ